MSKRSKNSCWVYGIDLDSATGSSIWKIWVGKDAADVYIAPHRMAGEFKLSIHRDKNNQLGFYTDQIKQSIRKGDKHFFNRWQRPTTPFLNEENGWNTLAGILFDPLEFEPINMDLIKPGSTAIPIINSNYLISICILETQNLSSAKDFDNYDEFSVIKTFLKPDGGAIAVISAPIPRMIDQLAALDTDNNGFGWHPPITKRQDGPFGFIFSNGTFPCFAEYSTNNHAPPPAVPYLRNFHGTVHRWSEVPPEYANYDAFCAILTCSSHGAQLFVDPRSHCNQDHLVADANALIQTYALGKIDGGWVRLSDGRFATAILTEETADDQKFSNYFPSPLKQPKYQN